MVTDSSPVGAVLFILPLFFLGGTDLSPIECFGRKSELLEDITHNIIWGEYVS